MKRHMQVAIPVALFFCLAPADLVELEAADVVVESAQVRLIDDVEVPAQVKGVLKSVDFREGQHVGEGDPIARLDDAEARLERDRTQIELDKAEKIEKDDVKLRLARKAVRDAEIAVERAKLDLLIAGKQAENDVKVRLSKKTLAVAEAELDRALKSRSMVTDAVSLSEIDMLKLAVDRSALEIEQAEMENEIARLTLRVQEAEAKRLEVAIEKAALDEEQAKHDLEVAVDDRRAKANGLETAELQLQQRQIVSPVSGVVAKVFHRRGEWVEPGETVMRIVRLDRLRIEGFVNAADLDSEMNGASTKITAEWPGRPKLDLVGEVVFISPEIDPVNNQVRIWAEFDNPKLQLRPGMRVTMTVQVKDKEE